jgi:hypothetical protein
VVADDEQDPFGGGHPGEVVQQAEAALVRLVQVVDREHRAGAARGQAQELGDRDE